MTAPTFDHAAVLRVSPGAVVRRIREEAVVLVLGENRFLAISEVGARTLELIDGRTPLGDILERLHAEYDVSREQLDSDVLSFLGQLLAARVVDQEPAAGDAAGRATPTACP